MLARVWDWLIDADWKTWVGHGLMGALLQLVFGLGVVFGAFAYREASDLLAWYLDERPVDRTWEQFGGAPGFKRPFRAKLKDGFFDLWAPLVGASLVMLVQYL